MEIVRKINGEEKETTIDHIWEQPDAKVYVTIKNGSGNAGSEFRLDIEGGQVDFTSSTTGGTLQIFGQWERECWIELLKQIIIELEAIKQ